MTLLSRLKHRAIARVLTRLPRLARRFTDACDIREPQGKIPWTPPTKNLSESRVALVSTCGVHRRDQEPFAMNDPLGDPSFRIIDGMTAVGDLTITHDYYDHADADRDINVVFPIERLREFAGEGIIGGLADLHFGFMGHITGMHVETLVNRSAPEAAAMFRANEVDLVLLTPA